MTWRLVVEQVRTHRTITIWTASLLTVLVAILTLLTVSGLTQATLEQQSMATHGADRERHGWTEVFVGDVPPGVQAITVADLMERVDAAADAEGVAVLTTWLATTNPDEYVGVGPDPEIVQVQSNYGDIDTALLKTSGMWPDSPGEIALAATLAESLGIGIGDRITLYKDGPIDNTGRSGYVPVEFTVVGLTASSGGTAYDSYVSQAFLPWEDAALGREVMLREREWPSGSAGSWADAELHWNAGAPSLDVFYEPGRSYATNELSLPSSSLAWLTGAIVLFIAIVVMSFAVGRSQAAARTQWIATARTLGATRSYVAWASVLETILLGAVAFVLGLGLGVLAAQLQYSSARGSVPLHFGPETVTLDPLLLVLVGIVTALAVAAIAAVPAFWASRVAPVAAFKPVNDLTEATVSRTVSVRWVWIPLVGGIAFLLAAFWNSTTNMDGLLWFGLLLIAPSSIALVTEWMRRLIPIVGRRVAARRDPAVLSAGDALVARPRQAVAPALLMLFGAAALTLSLCASAGSGLGQLRHAQLTVIAITALALQLVTAAIFAARRAANERESAIRRALGIRARDEARAQWWQQWLPQVIGGGGGILLGSAAYVFIIWLQAVADYDPGVIDPVHGLVIGSLLSLAVLGVVLVLAAVVAWLGTGLRKPTSPVALLHRAS